MEPVGPVFILNQLVGQRVGVRNLDSTETQPEFRWNSASWGKFCLLLAAFPFFVFV